MKYIQQNFQLMEQRRNSFRNTHEITNPHVFFVLPSTSEFGNAGGGIVKMHSEIIPLHFPLGYQGHRLW